MSLSEIQRSVNSLKRRLALPIAVIRMRRVVDDVCDQWGAAQADGKPLPRPFQVVTSVLRAGCRHGEPMALGRYIRRCLDENENPDPHDMVRALLPRAARLGLVAAHFRYDRISHEPTPQPLW